MQVIISNGFNKFFLSFAAETLQGAGRLSALLTGAYPTQTMRRVLSLLGLERSAYFAKLLRRAVRLPASKIDALFFSEIFSAIGVGLQNSRSTRSFGIWLSVVGLRLYGWQARKHVRRAADGGAGLYHYRAGFGGASLALARKRGLHLLCDHSIAHPDLVEYMVQHGGQYPDDETFKVPSYWTYILKDIRKADSVIVNSDFVKETFLRRGWQGDNIHVLYWGLDDEFMAFLPPIEKRPVENRPLHILFAGGFDERKGAQTVIDAILQLEDWKGTFTIAGSISPDIRRSNPQFFDNPRVIERGWIPRRELAACMAKSDIFLFPSLAEGSARVIFEAMAAGCYIVTTANAGSIVQDGVHGALVPPGAANAVTGALRDALRDPARVSAIGSANARTIRDCYTQKKYGDSLLALYQHLAGSTHTPMNRDARK